MREALNRLLNKCEGLARKLSHDAGDLLNDTSGHELMTANKLIPQPASLNNKYIPL